MAGEHGKGPAGHRAPCCSVTNREKRACRRLGTRLHAAVCMRRDTRLHKTRQGGSVCRHKQAMVMPLKVAKVSYTIFSPKLSSSAQSQKQPYTKRSEKHIAEPVQP